VIGWAIRIEKPERGRDDFLILHLLLGSKLSFTCVKFEGEVLNEGNIAVAGIGSVVQEGITAEELEEGRIGFGKLLCLRSSLDRLNCKVRLNVKAARIGCAKGDACKRSRLGSSVFRFFTSFV
jgi:hypothetical protein